MKKLRRFDYWWLQAKLLDISILAKIKKVFLMHTTVIGKAFGDSNKSSSNSNGGVNLCSNGNGDGKVCSDGNVSTKRKVVNNQPQTMARHWQQ